MKTEPLKTRDTAPERRPLDEREFIRQRLHGGNRGAVRRYASLVLARPTTLGLLKYELVNLFGGIPGALGLAIRKWLYPRLLGRTGKSPIFGRNITLRHADNIYLGDRVVLDDYCLVDARGAGEHGIRLGDGVMVHRNASIQSKVGHISIGANSSVGALSQIVSQGAIEIAENVSIAGGVGIAGGRYQVELDEEGPQVKKRFTAGPIRIGPNVRLGRGAIILDGVSIGAGAIVAPGSVVMSDVPENTVVIGCPARPLRSRGDVSREPAVAATPGNSEGGQREAQGHVTPAMEEIRSVIRRYLEETHFAEFRPGELGDDDSLFDHGILDSAGVVAMLTMLEREYGLHFDESALQPEMLSTVNGLAALTSGQLREHTGGTRQDWK